jgi:hypothetical protein
VYHACSFQFHVDLLICDSDRFPSFPAYFCFFRVSLYFLFSCNILSSICGWIFWRGPICDNSRITHASYFCFHSTLPSSHEGLVFPVHVDPREAVPHLKKVLSETCWTGTKGNHHLIVPWRSFVSIFPFDPCPKDYNLSARSSPEVYFSEIKTIVDLSSSR